MDRLRIVCGDEDMQRIARLQNRANANWFFGHPPESVTMIVSGNRTGGLWRLDISIRPCSPTFSFVDADGGFHCVRLHEVGDFSFACDLPQAADPDIDTELECFAEPDTVFEG